MQCSSPWCTTTSVEGCADHTHGRMLLSSWSLLEVWQYATAVHATTGTLHRLQVPRRNFKCSGDELTATCARLGLGASRSAPRLRFVLSVVWSSVGVGHQHPEKRWSAAPRLEGPCVGEQHSGRALLDTEVRCGRDVDTCDTNANRDLTRNTFLSLKTCHVIQPSGWFKDKSERPVLLLPCTHFVWSFVTRSALVPLESVEIPERQF